MFDSKFSENFQFHSLHNSQSRTPADLRNEFIKSPSVAEIGSDAQSLVAEHKRARPGAIRDLDIGVMNDIKIEVNSYELKKSTVRDTMPAPVEILHQ